MNGIRNLQRSILLIPGPLTTSQNAKQALTFDYSAREPLFVNIIKSVREKILSISNTNPNNYTSILVQGSGTFGNEAIISSLPKKSKISVFSNGLYGDRLIDICKKHNVLHSETILEYNKQITPYITDKQLKNCDSTHIAIIHNETTSGILNPIEEIVPIAKKYNKKVIIDAISSYGGIPIDINSLEIDYLVGSSNKCLHAHPGLSFIIANKSSLEECKNNNNTLSLDLYDQYQDLEKQDQFRYTPPVQIINALNVALDELIRSGGIERRYEYYLLYNSIIYNELINLGFKPYISRKINGPIVTTFILPDYVTNFSFESFSQILRDYNIVLYPSPLNDDRLIRIGNIGDININELYFCIKKIKEEIIKLK